MGRSRGLALGYNPQTIKLSSAWGGKGLIGIEIFSSELGMDLRVINVYGPFQGREAFWNQLLNLSITSANDIILGGDLNFSISFSESWGSSAQSDPISDTIETLLDHAHLLDIPINRPLPTWRNIRLDCFTLKTPMLQRLSHYTQWVRSGGISDHLHIYLEISGPPIKPKAPFKFNSTWLQDPSYSKLITDFWLQNPPIQGLTWAEGLCHNLLHLKKLTINWAKEKSQRDDHTLVTVEYSLA